MTASGKLATISNQAKSWLWNTEIQSIALWQKIAIYAIRICFAVFRDLKDGQLSLRAMSLVYTTVIAIVPLLALSFSVLKGFGLHNQVEPALLEALVDIGDKRFDIVAKIMGFIDNIKVGVLGSVGFALLIYSVIAMMHKIEHSFNYTWQIKRSRTLSQRFGDYLSVIFVGPLLIFLSAAITTSANTDAAMTYIEMLPFGSSFVSIISTLIPYLIMSLGFTFIYMFLPNTQVQLLPAFIGGSVTAVIWKIMGWGIAIFVANSASSVAIYSAFASIIILMTWIYIGWIVLLIGASVSFYCQNPKYILVRKDNVELSGENREKLAISIMYHVCRRYQNSLPAYNADALAEQLHVASHMVDDMVEHLCTQGYLVQPGEENSPLYPKRPANQIKIVDLLSQTRTLQKDGNSINQMSLELPVSQLFGDLNDVLTERFGDTSIHDLIVDEKIEATCDSGS